MIEQFRGENTFREAVGWAEFSAATKFLALTAFLIPAYGIYEKGIAYPVNFSPEATKNEMIFGFASGAVLLALSLPSDVISGAKFLTSAEHQAARLINSAKYGIKVMVENMDNISQSFQAPRF